LYIPDILQENDNLGDNMADDKAIQFANKQRIKEDLFIKFLDNHDAIYSNVKEYFASEGEQNSLYPIYQKMFLTRKAILSIIKTVIFPAITQLMRAMPAR
jgi:hypothetical protein